MRRAVLVYLLYPVVLLGIYASLTRVLAEIPEPNPFNSLSGMGPIGLFLLFLQTCAFAMPLLLIALWRRWLNLITAALLGALAGFLAYYVPHAGQLVDQRPITSLGLEGMLAWPFAAAGGVAAVLLWLPAAWHNTVFKSRARENAV
jgi:hypothetical protein